MSFDERAELLENNRELATIHERCALEGQTQVSYETSGLHQPPPLTCHDHLTRSYKGAWSG